jgi:hypothetical protein
MAPDQPAPFRGPYAAQERRQTPRWPVSRMCVRCGSCTPSSAYVLCEACNELALTRYAPIEDHLAPARGFVIGACLGVAFWLAVVALAMVIG